MKTKEFYMGMARDNAEKAAENMDKANAYAVEGYQQLAQTSEMIADRQVKRAGRYFDKAMSVGQGR